MLELLGSSGNSRTRNGWRRLKMLHQIKRPPLIDLPSEMLILTLKISPSKHICKAPQHVLTRNNVVTKANYIIWAREWVGLMPRYIINSKFFQTDLSKERETPHLENSWWKWCCEHSLQHPTTQHYSAAKIMLYWRRMLGLKPRCEEKSVKSLKRPLNKERKS